MDNFLATWRSCLVSYRNFFPRFSLKITFITPSPHFLSIFILYIHIKFLFLGVFLRFFFYFYFLIYLFYSIYLFGIFKIHFFIFIFFTLFIFVSFFYHFGNTFHFCIIPLWLMFIFQPVPPVTFIISPPLCYCCSCVTFSVGEHVFNWADGGLLRFPSWNAPVLFNDDFYDDW